MRMLMLGAASLALAASATYADPGKGNGGGNGGGHGGGHAAAAGPSMKGGGNGTGNGKGQGQDRAGPQMNAKADKGQARTAQAQARGPERKAERVVAQTDNRGNGNGNGKGRQDVVRSVDRDNVRVVREVREVRGNGGRDGVRVVRTIGFDDRGSRGLIDGCPPGLAKKNNGCQPPGLARQDGTYRNDRYYSPSWFGYPSLGDGRYYYDDGYLYRTSNTGSVLGYLPLLGGALSVGNPWPSYYDPYPVPDYYVDYYNLGAPNSYRYADDVLYRVDPQSNAITSIAALLTGDQFAVGQRMPLGYDVYNVPYAYRDQYLDGPDAYYRYADGYVYEVDPTTQLIQAAIQLLT